MAFYLREIIPDINIKKFRLKSDIKEKNNISLY